MLLLTLVVAAWVIFWWGSIISACVSWLVAAVASPGDPDDWFDHHRTLDRIYPLGMMLLGLTVLLGAAMLVATP